MKTLEKIRTKKEIIEAIAKKYGLTEIFIFGSVARGDDDKDSDIDILVTSNDGTTLFDLGGFYSELEEIFGKRLSIVTRNSLRGRLKENVLKEAVPL
jgi:predicted nucleotidyltransferase